MHDLIGIGRGHFTADFSGRVAEALQGNEFGTKTER
jgi:hypothetical protein